MTTYWSESTLSSWCLGGPASRHRLHPLRPINLEGLAGSKVYEARHRRFDLEGLRGSADRMRVAACPLAGRGLGRQGERESERAREARERQQVTSPSSWLSPISQWCGGSERRRECTTRHQRTKAAKRARSSIARISRAALTRPSNHFLSGVRATRQKKTRSTIAYRWCVGNPFLPVLLAAGLGALELSRVVLRL